MKLIGHENYHCRLDIGGISFCLTLCRWPSSMTSSILFVILWSLISTLHHLINLGLNLLNIFWTLLHSSKHYCILMNIIAFFWTLLHSSKHYCILLNITAFFWTLLHSYEHYCILLNIIAFFWILLRYSFWTLLHSSEHYCILLNIIAFFQTNIIAFFWTLLHSSEHILLHSSKLLIIAFFWTLLHSSEHYSILMNIIAFFWTLLYYCILNITAFTYEHWMLLQSVELNNCDCINMPLCTIYRECEHMITRELDVMYCEC